MGRPFCAWGSRYPRRSAFSLSARNTLRSDWYGTSRRLAKIFRSSIMATGRRMEMVRSVGFRLGNFARLACAQSKYSVESDPFPVEDQKSNSSASLLNLGIGFLMRLVSW